MKRIILGLLCAIVASSAYCKTFTFTSLEFPPLEYTGKDNRPDGAAVEVVRTIMKNLGHEVKIHIYPWARSLRMVKNGEADAIFTAYITDERLKFLDYSKQILINQSISLYVKKGNKLSFDGDLTKLKQKIIGVTSTISYGKIFDTARVEIPLKTQRVEDLGINFRKLVAGRIDYLVSNSFSAATIITKSNLAKKVEELPKIVEAVPSYIGFSKKNGLSALRDDFDKALKKLKKSGEYRKILNKHNVKVITSSAE